MPPDGGQNMIGQNLALRAALLASAPRMRKRLGTFTSAVAGDTTRVKLFNVGVITRLLLLIEVQVDIGTAVAVPSAKAPYNLINRIRLTDFDGTDRVNLSGHQLFVLNSVRGRAPYGINNEGLTAVATLPDVPTAVGNNAVIRFLLEVPVAFAPESDLRGAILAQTAVGEMFLNIDWNGTLYANGNIEAVYSGAATTTVALDSYSVTVFQEYLLPQALGGQVPLPMLDLMTVYELAGNLRATDNLVAGQERLINYPNQRSVIGAYVTYVHNNQMSDADLTQWRVIANGNNILRENNRYDKIHEQRVYLNGDLKEGVWWELSREKPIETALYGNVQLGFTPANVTAGGYVELGFESFYAKGAALPGLTQAAS